MAPHCLLECWEVYMDIITTLRATLTTSEADPVDLLSNAPQQIKEDGKELADCGFSSRFLWMFTGDDEVRGIKCVVDLAAPRIIRRTSYFTLVGQVKRKTSANCKNTRCFHQRLLCVCLRYLHRSEEFCHFWNKTRSFHVGLTQCGLYE